YNVTQTVTSGSCSATFTLTITVYAEPAATIVGTDISCSGNCDGSANLTPVGGTSPYTFSWSNSANTEDISGLCIGTYNVTIADANGCTGTASVVIGTPTALSVGVTGTDILCNGSCTGTATATPTGGTGPYTYAWDDPGFQSTPTASNLCVGIANVTITDAGGCTTTGSYNVVAPAPMVLSLTAINASCGLSDGSVSVSIAGGTGPFTYLWSGGCSTSSCTGLPSGTYFLSVTDGNGCTASDLITVNDAGGGGVASVTLNNNLDCFGVCIGQATASITGGSAPFAYLWSDPAAQTTPVATGLCAGTFSVAITDNTGCTSTALVTVTEPPALNAVVTGSTNTLCFGSCDGSATVSASGGSGSYVYSWDNPGASTTVTTSSDLCAGITYTATVTDGNGCTSTATVVVSEPPQLNASIVGTDALCNGGNTGLANLTPSGGTGPYNFLWSTSDITEDISNLIAGTYSVTVTDANLCTATGLVVIGEPGPLTLPTTVVNAACGLANGSACVTPTGGIGPYTYSWNDSLNQTVACAVTLPGGSYTVTVTDNNGCTDIATVTVNDLPGGNAVATLVSNTSGFNICDGQASATLTSGTAPYTYIWNDPANQTTATATALCSGTFCVTITDAVGCSSSDCIVITEPPAIATVVTGVDLLCNSICNGSATLTISGGNAPYVFNWTGGFTTQNVAGLCAGTYYVTVTDANSVSVIDSVEILEPPALVLIMSGTDAVCNNACDGTANVTVSGGTGLIIYQWDDPAVQTTATATGLCAGTYNVITTDANGCSNASSYVVNEPPAIIVNVTNVDANCNQADGSVTAVVTNGVGALSYLWSTSCTNSTCTALASGTYNVTVTDLTGCTGVGAGAIADLIGPSAVIQSSFDVTCAGGLDGQATVAVNDGTPPYTYSWNTSPMETTTTATDLPAGSTIISITDVSGCITTVTVLIGEPTPLVVVMGTSDPSCNVSCDGFGSATVSGGTAPYTYLWDDPGAQATPSASGLCAGVYVVNIEDVNGCTATGSVTLTDPAVLILSVVPSDAFCGGSCDGSATVTAFGGTAPYGYAWNSIPVQTTQIADSLCAATYVITVTDGNGCTASSTTVIGEPAPLIPSISSSGDVSCNGACDGFAQSGVSGGAPPYTYLWSNSMTTDQITNLCAGIYDLTVTDANACSAVTSVTISAPPPMIGNMTSQNVSCNNACDGLASVAVSGGLLPYTFLWNDPYFQTTFTADSLCAGSFSVVISDLNGCSIIRTVNITEPQPLSYAGSAVASTCGNENGSACVAVIGGIIPYTIVWNDPALTVGTCIDSVFAGVYNPILTDGNGCAYTDPVIINDITGPIIDTVITTDLLCFGDASGTATVNFSSGTAPYTYTWKDGNGVTISTGSGFIFGLSGGTYTITIEDVNNCTVSQLFSIFEPLQLASAINGFSDISCFGACDGTASVVVGNGTTPYTYLWAAPSSSTVANPTGLCFGVNNVLVTDANGCTTANLVNLTEPPELVISSVVSDVSCFGSSDGQIVVTSSGGSQPHTYLWLPSGSGTGTMANNLAVGSYTVQVTDNNFCDTNVVMVIVQPQILTANGITSPSSCGNANGDATVTPMGGTGAYTYEWYDDQGTPLGQTTSNAVGLVEGNYDVIITDANGCSFTITLPVLDNEGPTISNMASTPVSCYGGADGTATVFPAGGTIPYTYMWDDLNVQTNAAASGLIGGTYEVTLTDVNSCVVTASVVVVEPPELVLQMLIDTSICIGGQAIIAVVASGGTNEGGGPTVYTYTWDNGLPGVASSTVNPGSQTTYNVTVTDINGCPAYNSMTVSIYPPLIVTVSDDEICGGDNATLTADVTGGNPNFPYFPNTFLWDDPGASTSQTITVSPANTTNYSVTVGDQNCTP
ncbi:MAG: SprB repeat-containing protein, partial [Flavobacteriales bacterium]|nr:SprB repeat-containing protein [Flavobacteriales bacterium]